MSVSLITLFKEKSIELTAPSREELEVLATCISKDENGSRSGRSGLPVSPLFLGGDEFVIVKDASYEVLGGGGYQLEYTFLNQAGKVTWRFDKDFNPLGEAQTQGVADILYGPAERQQALLARLVASAKSSQSKPPVPPAELKDAFDLEAATIGTRASGLTFDPSKTYSSTELLNSLNTAIDSFTLPGNSEDPVECFRQLETAIRFIQYTINLEKSEVTIPLLDAASQAYFGGQSFFYKVSDQILFLFSSISNDDPIKIEFKTRESSIGDSLNEWRSKILSINSIGNP